MLTLLVFLAAYAIIILLPLTVPLTPQEVHGMLGSARASVAESCVISVRKQGDAGAS